jgi:SAM-dependent methyltransferase
MSERFAPAWLDLREPADRAARNRPLLDRLAAWCRDRAELRVVDLGAGTGANLRRTAPALHARQDWTLVELDPALIEAGSARLARSDAAWRYRRLDLARDLEALADSPPPDLITAAALIALVSAAWLERLAALRARTGAALYVALTVDGRVRWTPADPHDAPCTALVQRHQHIDKGFGPALGFDAAPTLMRLLDAQPGELLLGRSDWNLGVESAALQAELLEGYVAAASALAPERRPALAAWGERRRAGLAQPEARLLVGHLDLLFLPELL